MLDIERETDVPSRPQLVGGKLKTRKTRRGSPLRRAAPFCPFTSSWETPNPSKWDHLSRVVWVFQCFEMLATVTTQMMFGGKTRYKRCDIVNQRILITQTTGPLFYTKNANSAAETVHAKNTTLKQGSHMSCVDVTADTPIRIYGYMILLLCLS